MVSASKNARWLRAALFIVSAVLFAIGVALERSAESDEPNVTQESGESDEARHSEAEEAEESHSEEGEGEATEEGAESHSESKETLFGINLESPLAVAAGVVVSLVLAGLGLRSQNRTVLIVIGLFALAFAVLDGKELFHQLNEDRTGLAVLAGAIALLHLGAAVIAGRVSRASTA